MAEVSTAPIQSLEDGGFLTAITDEAPSEWRRVPVADVNAAATDAAAAVAAVEGQEATLLDLQDQITANAEVFTDVVDGRVPASGGGTANYLRADGTWVAPPGSSPGAGLGDVVGPASVVNGRPALFDGTTGKLLKQGTANAILEGDARLTDTRVPSAHAHPVDDVTGLQAELDAKASGSALTALAASTTAALAGKASTAVFTPSVNGLAPLSGGGTANFLRADGSWAAPPGGGGGSGDVVGPAGVTDGRPALFDGGTGKLLKQGTAVAILEGDARLTNARTPTTHAHPTSDVTGLDTALAGKVVGPASVTADRAAVFDGTTGKLIKAHTAALGTMAAATAADYTTTAATPALLTTIAAHATNGPIFGAAITVAVTSLNAAARATFGSLVGFCFDAVATAGGAAASALGTTLANLVDSVGEVIVPATATHYWTDQTGFYVGSPEAFAAAMAWQTLTPSAGTVTVNGAIGWRFKASVSGAVNVVVAALTPHDRILRLAASSAATVTFTADVKTNFGSGATISIPSGATAEFTISLDSTNVTVRFDRILGTTGLGGLQTMSLPAGSWKSRPTSGAEFVTSYEGATNKNTVDYFAFDPNSDEHIQTLVHMPAGWNLGPLTCAIRWKHPAATTNYDVTWGVRAVSYGDGDAIDAAFSTAVTVTDAGGTTGSHYKAPITAAFTPTGGPAIRDSVLIEIFRDTDGAGVAGNDDLAVDAHFLGAQIFFTVDSIMDD